MEAKRLVGTAVVSGTSFANVAAQAPAVTQSRFLPEIKKMISEEMKELTHAMLNHIKQLIPQQHVETPMPRLDVFQTLSPAVEILATNAMDDESRGDIRPKPTITDDLITPIAETSSNPTYMDDESRGEKRKTELTRSQSTSSSVASIDTAALELAKHPKKKKGWPKGKPRGTSSQRSHYVAEN